MLDGRGVLVKRIERIRFRPEASCQGNLAANALRDVERRIRDAIGAMGVNSHLLPHALGERR